MSFAVETSRLYLHPSIHTLFERFSLGASWACSLQQVLLHDNRPRFPSLRWELGQDFAASELLNYRRINSMGSARSSMLCCAVDRALAGALLASNTNSLSGTLNRDDPHSRQTKSLGNTHTPGFSTFWRPRKWMTISAVNSAS